MRIWEAISFRWARGGAVGRGTAWRSRVRFPMVSLEFVTDIIFSAALWPCLYDSASNSNSGKGGRSVELTTLPLLCRLSWNLGAPTSWNPQCLSRPVMGWLYLCIFENNLLRLKYHEFTCCKCFCCLEINGLICQNIKRRLLKRKWRKIDRSQQITQDAENVLLHDSTCLRASGTTCLR
jgi:hypothetical protein